MLRNAIQKLEPGSLVTLIEVDCTEFSGDILYFHGHNVSYSQKALEGVINPLYAGSLTWEAGNLDRYAGEGGSDDISALPIIFGGVTYSAWPCQVEGIEFDSSGQPTNPTLSVGNIDGSISSLCLFFDDLLQAKVTIRQTLSKYLDSANFTEINPDADPTQQIVETWYIDSKTQEDNETVSWKLSSPGDVSGQIIPARLITTTCEWALRGEYRGPDCQYMGAAMFDLNDQPTDDPSEDKCAGMLNSCRCRFGDNEQLNIGAFVGANLLGK